MAGEKILTCKELFETKQQPRINELSLDLLREYYETHLHPYIFKFEIKDDVKNTSETFELRFDQENFCHLLGIESIVKRTVNKEDITNYRGQAGWDNVANGTLNFSVLKQKKTKSQFKSKKEKYIFFYLIPRLIDAPKAVLYDATLVEGSTTIDCEILFYDNMKDANSYVHLGIKYDEKLGYHIAKTFFVERNKVDALGDKYIVNQKEILVSKLDRTPIKVE